MTTFEEWRVTGRTARGQQTIEDWSPLEDSDCEAKARRFLDWARDQGWSDGPRLHRRTVSVTEWEEVQP